MKLTLIRHGRTEGNIKGLYYGSTDLPLLPCGIEELEELKKECAYPTAERFFTSGMLRTEQTLRVLYGDVPHEKLPELREIDCGDFEMRSYEQLKNDPAYQAWITGDIESNVCPNGESYAIVTRRALSALEPIIAADEDALVITHGGVIGCVLCALFPFKTRYDFRTEPGCGFQLEFENGSPVRLTRVPAEE